jgi:hypothetical protein
MAIFQKKLLCHCRLYIINFRVYRYIRFLLRFQDIWEIFSPPKSISPRLSVEVIRFVGDVYIIENDEKRLLLSGENASEATISADEKRVAIIGTIPNTLTHAIHILDVDGKNHKKFLFDCTIMASALVENLSWSDNNKVRVYFECTDNAGKAITATIENFPIVEAGYYDLHIDEHNSLLEIQPFP